MTSLGLFVFAIISFHSVNAYSAPPINSRNAEKNTDFWYEHGAKEIHASERLKQNHNRAKNAILFLGDGMSITTLTAARILKGQLKQRSGEEGQLHFETFPYASLIKTYNLDRQVPDSAGTATAFLCGVKANYETLGVNAHIKAGDTDCDAIRANSVNSILKWAIDSGKSAGVVTTTRITHATPGASYSHVGHRDWENNAALPNSLDPKCKDIARQLIEDAPGNQLRVILGGGRRHFLPKHLPDHFDKTLFGERTDGVNLIDKWLEGKRTQTERINQFQFVNSSAQLRNVDFTNVEYLMGLFNYNHVSYHAERDTNQEPSLEEMTQAALKVLGKNPNGYVLLVEGGRIDHAHHQNWANQALRETISFDETIESVSKIVNEEETLLVVTADHAHTLTINGYPERGNPISGFSDHNETGSEMLFTTMMYGNGPGNTSPRQTPVHTDQLRYRQHSAVHLVESAHGGEDVALYSTGPMAHMFHGNQEQSYVAHVIAYATCIGNYGGADHCKVIARRSVGGLGSSASTTCSSVLINLIAFYLMFAYNHRL